MLEIWRRRYVAAFLLSRPAKTPSLAQVFRMSDADAEAMFCKVRWPETEGKPVRPNCGGLDTYECSHSGSVEDFTVTSGTLFAFHKLPLKGYLAAIAIFCNEVKGKSMLAMSRDLGVSYKCAFVLCHKLREAMAEEMKGRTLGGSSSISIKTALSGESFVKLDMQASCVCRDRREFATATKAFL
jgi:hypothetical protein